MKVNVWGVTAGLVALLVADAIYAVDRVHGVAWLAGAIIKDSLSFTAGVLALWLSVKEAPDAE